MGDGVGVGDGFGVGDGVGVGGVLGGGTLGLDDGVEGAEGDPPAQAVTAKLRVSAVVASIARIDRLPALKKRGENCAMVNHEITNSAP